MKRRLRKKKRIGEFAQYGFNVEFRLDSSLSDTAGEAMFDRFIADAIEANDLICGGGGKGTKWGVYAHPTGRATATEQHQEGLRTWFAATPEVISYYVGPLTDAWYGPFEDAPEGPWTHK